MKLLQAAALCVTYLSLTVHAYPSSSLSSRNNDKKIPDLLTVTLDELSDGLSKGYFTSVQLVEAYLARINQSQPILRAVIETNPYALEEAAMYDSMRKDGKAKDKGPLFGVPILVKDNIATARPDQTYMNTTAGSFALVGSIPPEDATVAAKLKKASAIILGKANLSQWANYRSTNGTSSNGWSSRGGQTTAAYYPNQDPSGSSSGSGVASSVGLALATLGTETSGSILSPGQANNLCAIKPTVGLTSRYLVIPISENQDTIGPMARDCKTAAHILTAISGKDPDDPATLAAPFDKVPDYAAACSSSKGLKGARIGVPSSFITNTAANTVEIAAFNASFQTMRSLGASVQLETNFPDLAGYRNPNNTAIRSVQNPIDFIFNLKTYLDSLTFNPEGITDLEVLSDFTRSTPAEEYPDRNIGVWDNALSLNLTQDSPEYLQAVALNKYLGSNATITGALDKFGLDALILPTSQSAGVAAIAGLPVITVPLGFYPATQNITLNPKGTLVANGPNRPFGISFLGRPWSEEKLIQYACAFEAATQVRAKGPQPYFIPNINLADFV